MRIRSPDCVCLYDPTFLPDSPILEIARFLSLSLSLSGLSIPFRVYLSLAIQIRHRL